MDHKINQLTKISREKSSFFEDFYDWGSYTFTKKLVGKIWFMDESLISIYGTKEYEMLSGYQKKYLSYLESCQITYTYSSTEAIFCLFLARYILLHPIGTPQYEFIVREQIEEYRHQDMFARVLDILESEHVEISPLWKWTMKQEALYVFPKYFFILQVVIEIISGDFGGKCIKNKEVFKLVRDCSTIHEIEEARHLAFAQILLDDYFKDTGFFGKTLGGWFVLLDVLFINVHYIQKQNFEKLGVENSNNLYKIAKQNWKINKLKNFDSTRGIAFMKRYGFMTWGNRWAFKLFLGFSIK